LPKASDRGAVELDLAALVERQLTFDALLDNMTEGFALCEATWDA
jgi:hypothetical protein